MIKPDNYLKLYSERYFLTATADGMVDIYTKFRIPDTPRDWCTVYLFSDTHLAVLLPRKVGIRLAHQKKDVFRIHQDALDGIVLVFEEARLHDLAGVLRLRRRIRLSDAKREKLIKAGQEFRFALGL